MLSVKMKPTFEHSPPTLAANGAYRCCSCCCCCCCKHCFVLPASDNVPGQQKPCWCCTAKTQTSVLTPPFLSHTNSAVATLKASKSFRILTEVC